MENITEAELDKIRNCKSAADWNKACNDVKAAHSGAYPPDWYAKVMLSGLARTVMAGFGKSPEIGIAPLDDDEPKKFIGARTGQTGFTVIELLIVMVVIFIFAAAIGGGFSSCAYADEARARADHDAVMHIRTLHPSWTEVHSTCQATDSDGDGYVTCSIAAKNSAGAEVEEPLECRHSVFFDYSRGCRPMRTIMNGGYRR